MGCCEVLIRCNFFFLSSTDAEMSRMHICCITGCYNRLGRPGIGFFAVPSGETRRKQWLRFIGEGVRIGHNSRVCGAHFTPDDFLRSGYLKRDAIPTIPASSTLTRHGSGHLKRQAIPTIPASPSLTRHESSFEGSSAVNLIGNSESPGHSAVDDGCMELVTNEEVDESGVKQELCRVCGSKDDSLISIFETTPIENTHHFSLVKILELYLPLKIQEDDNLPCKICSKCSCMVNQWHEFYIRCVAADKTFQRMFCKGNLEEDRGVPVTRSADEVVHLLCKECSMEDPVLEMREDVDEHDYSRSLESDGSVNKNCDKSKDITSCTVNKGYLRSGNVIKNCDQSRDVTFCTGTISEEEKLKYTEIPTYQVPLVSCRICCNIFDDRSSWRSHHQACQDSLTICEECGKIIPRKYLKRHKSRYHSAKKLCDRCGERFYPRFLSSHMLSHHSETYYCELCWQMFKTKPGLQKHLIKHQTGELKTANKVKTLRKEDKIIFVCPVCNLSFDDKRSLLAHLNKPKRVKCPVCRLVLNNERLFYRHKCKKLYCQHCFQSFYNKTRLLDHERTHTGETPYKCNICNQSFKTACARGAHQRTVHGDPTYECTYCPKKYYLPSRLRYHMDIHEGVRFPCPLCDKQLKRSYTLRKHIKLHKMGRI